MSTAGSSSREPLDAGSGERIIGGKNQMTTGRIIRNLVLLAVVAAIATNIPDIRRYLKIRNM